MGLKFREPLKINQGTGITVVPNNTELFGAVSPSQTITISIGQDLETTSNITFNVINASSQFIIDNESMVLQNGLISGSVNLVGDISTTENLIVNGDMTISGDTIANKIESKLSQSITIFESGSSIFGDSSDDTHQFSGSVFNIWFIIFKFKQRCEGDIK